MKPYYQRIRELREDRDIKQTEISKYLKLDQSNYSKCERGKQSFTVEQIIKICEYYHVSADWILGLKE